MRMPAVVAVVVLPDAVIIMTCNTGPDHLLHFRAEFLNRLDETVVFRALDAENLRQSTGLLVGGTRDRLRGKDITLDVTDEAVDWLATTGYVPEFGARPLRPAPNDLPRTGPPTFPRPGRR